MEKNTVSGIMLTLLLIAISTSALYVQPAKAEPKTWTVDNDRIECPAADFTSIGSAIYAASAGDSIYVYNGTYYEHVYILKSLTLVGQNKYGTIIDGSGYGPIVEIYAWLTNFTSFTVRNAGWTNWERDNGIRLRQTQSSQVNDCIVSGCAYGIREMMEYTMGRKNVINGNTVSDCTEIAIGSSHPSSRDNIVTNNTITNSSCGIYFNRPYNMQILGNTISNMTGEGTYGIHFEGAGSNNIVVGNTVKGYTDYAIAIRNADRNLIRGNTLSNNFYGIELSQSSCDNTVDGNNASGNGIGISVFANSNNNLITANEFSDSVPVDSYISDIGIWVESSRDNTIHNNNITNNGNGFYLYSSSNNRLSSNNITDNWTGIQSIYSTNNEIIANKIAYNLGVGISLVYSSSNISLNNITNDDSGIVLQSSSDSFILNNNIAANNWYGVTLSDSSYNTFSCNSMANNRNGIWLDWSANNTFDGNNIEGSQEYGIWLALSSDNNTLIHNNIANNWAGIGLYQSYNNHIYHNNFINNLRNVRDLAWEISWILPSTNIWDNGYPSGGNYWSDYSDVDLFNGPNQDLFGMDGIWDHPYVIDAENQDGYPLVKPWPTIPATIDVDPDRLSLRSKGNWITVYMELPTGYDVNTVDVASIKLNNAFPVDFSAPMQVGDHDLDGIPDLMVKFNRAQLESYIYNVLGIKHGQVTLKITGQLNDGTPFEGSDTIWVNYAGDVNNDGTINILDAAIVSAHWYPGPPIGLLGYDANADLNNDGLINILDSGIVSSNWGQTTP